MENENKQMPMPDEYEQHIEESGGDYRVKASKFQNAVAKVLCVLAAVVLWFYAVSTDTAIIDKSFTGIPVDIRNLDVLDSELGLSVISGYGYTVDLTLSGMKPDVNSLSIDDITAYVDAGSVTEAGEYSLQIHVSVPSGITIDGQSANYVELYIDKRSAVSVPVVVDPIYSIEATYKLGELEPSFETVNVTGPEEELEKIDCAMVTLELGRISKSLTATGKLVLVDKSGTPISNPYVKLQTSEVSVKIPVYTEKEVPLTVGYKHGYYNDSNVNVTVTPSTVRLKGEPDILDDIDSIQILELDEKKIMEDTLQKNVAINIPDGTEIIGSRSADVEVKHKGTVVRDVVIDVSNLSVVNTDDIEYEFAVSEITVKFRGTQRSIQFLLEDPQNIIATVDLDYLGNVTDSVSVPVTVSVASALSGSVYELGEYTIDVIIK
ncbi:MAG: hypothetical protein IJY93_10105 [Clostridia bacterium]|nr:hypothetical protein [Clostridia bacterium]